MRLVLIPVFAVFAFPLAGWMPEMNYTVRAIIALVIYSIASITDALDGKIARKYNMVTDFGKFLDPIADKLLVTSALLSLVYDVKYGLFYLWATLIILTREFAVSGIRMIAASKGNVIAAGKMGKLKMIFQSAALVILLFAKIFTGTAFNVISTVGFVLMILAVILTIWSGAEYIIKNKELLSQMK